MLRIEITTGGNITYTSEYEKIEVGDQKRGYRSNFHLIIILQKLKAIFLSCYNILPI